MKDVLPISKRIRYIDQSQNSLLLPAYHAFSIDDALCTSISNEDDVTIVRTWVHKPTIVLGLQDTRLPYLKKGLPYLIEKGYNPVVRNSGGLAVVLDEEIVNITLLLQDKNKDISIDAAYESMYALIKEMFSAYTNEIEAKEITHSYCPGSYDLSIYDKKFAGISQRRVKNGIAIQIYLCVAKSGEKRAEIIKQFYELALQGKQTKIKYPTVDPSCMASLSDLLQIPLTVNDVLRLLKQALANHSSSLEEDVLTEEEAAIYHEKLPAMIQRNQDILEEYFSLHNYN